jgi:hypothetical protein
MPRHGVGLNELLGGGGCWCKRIPAELPKDEVGKPVRAPDNFPPDVTEVTVSVAGNLTTSITVSEADQRNARDMRARLKE